MREGGVKNCQKKNQTSFMGGPLWGCAADNVQPKNIRMLLRIPLMGGHSTTTGTEFCQFLYPVCGQKYNFFRPPPPHLVHVVIEWPLCYIMLCLFYWFSERNLYKYGGKFPMFLQWRFYSIGLWRYLYWYWWVHSDTQYLWQWYLYQYFWFLPLSMFLWFSNEFGQ